MRSRAPGLLAADEPAAVSLVRPEGQAGIVIACDHASKRIPRALGDLGLSAAELDRHIAWDIGAFAVAERLSARFDAILVAQNYSRLAIDCNRLPEAASSIPHLSEETLIPGNADLSPADAEARLSEIFDPYHRTLASVLDARAAAAPATVLLSVHSFTPVYKKVARPWEIGLLYNRDDRLTRHFHDHLAPPGDLTIGDNQPYAVSDQTDYTLPVHGEQRGIHHLMIELRQDLVADAAGQQYWAERVAVTLAAALESAGLAEALSRPLPTTA